MVCEISQAAVKLFGIEPFLTLKTCGEYSPTEPKGIEFDTFGNVHSGA